MSEDTGEPQVRDVDHSGLGDHKSSACPRCLYDDAIPGISFDDDRQCNYCTLHDEMDAQYPVGPEGDRALEALADEIRAAGKGKKFDCIVGVSGGCDSSFMVHRVVELGLRPLAVHFDNTWNSPLATQNIFAVLDKLDVPLETYVVDNREYDDIYRSFMLAGVKDIEAPTDIAFMATLYRAAARHQIRYIIEGHSFRTEGISPLGWLYMDGRYIESVHRKHGNLPMRTYPTMPIMSFMRWAAINRIRRIRPLYYMDYRKEQTKQFLSDTYGWQWYGGHHLENRFTAFYHTYFLPVRFGVDMRKLGYSALVRSGQMTRQEAADLLSTPPEWDPEILSLVKKRLDFSDESFDEVMNLPVRTHHDYQTYKRSFERLRLLFWILYKLDRVPKSFYVKFCKKAEPGT